MKLVIAEKPSLAQALAKVLGANRHCEGHLRRDAFAGRIARASEAERSKMRVSCSRRTSEVQAGI